MGNRHRHKASGQRKAVGVGGEVGDLRVQVDSVGVDLHTPTDRAQCAMASAAVAVHRRDSSGIGASANAAACCSGIDVRVHRRVGQDRDLPPGPQRHAVRHIGLARIRDVDPRLVVHGRDGTATDRRDVSRAAADGVRGHRDARSAIHQGGGDIGLRIVDDGQGRPRQVHGNSAARTEVDRGMRQPVARRRGKQPQRNAPGPEQQMLPGWQRADEVDVQGLRTAGAGEVNAGQRDAVQARTPRGVERDGWPAERVGQRELRAAGADDEVGLSTDQSADRQTFEQVLDLIASVLRRARTGAVDDHRRACGGVDGGRREPDRVGIDNDHEIAGVVGEPGDGRAIAAIAHLLAGGVAVTVDPQAVVGPADEVLARWRVGVDARIDLLLDEVAREADRNRFGVRDPRVVGEASAVDGDLVARHGGRGVEGLRLALRARQGREQPQRVVVELLHKVDAGGRQPDADTGCAARVVAHGVAGQEFVGRIEADHVASAVHADAGREQRSGVGRSGSEQAAELDVVAVDNDDAVFAIGIGGRRRRRRRRQRAARCQQR